MERIEADLLLPGDGAPVRNAVLVVDEETITYVGPGGDAPETTGATTTRAPVVMPGMWDCHTHFLGSPVVDLNTLPLQPVALRAARTTADARAALDAGVTSVREVGGLGVHLARAVNEGTVPGPHIYAAGAVLSATGGHADLHAFPLEWVAEFGHRSGELRVCDGPADCARAAREQLRMNAKLIKVCASGGVLTEVDDPHHQLFTAQELHAVVETAALSQRAVAAHCHGKAGIMAALEAGCLTIEHGTYLDAECCAAMKELGAILVPTRLIVEALREHDEIPEYARTKIRYVAEKHHESVALAHEYGITVAMGTDIALPASTGHDCSWGRHGQELVHLVQAGMSPLEAIRCATAHGPLTLGPQAPRSGKLEAGHDADVLALDADPLEDITVLADPRHVTGVWSRGRRVKGQRSSAD
jgi:imidazolonepropionase-like amidohydrolase